MTVGTLATCSTRGWGLWVNCRDKLLDSVHTLVFHRFEFQSSISLYKIKRETEIASDKDIKKKNARITFMKSY